MVLADIKLAVAAYLATINLIAFAIYAYDKHRAITQARRVPEATLLRLAGFGGALGALLAMGVVRHKTLKPRFRYGVPAMLLGHLALLGLIAWLMLGRPAFWA